MSARALQATRRVVALVGFTLALGMVIAGVALGSTTGTAVRGTFTIHFPKGHPASNAPCPSDQFCGVGSLAQYGPATITILDESFDEIAGSPCLAVTRVEQIDLLDGSGSLVTESIGTFCRPGGSGDSHASRFSYGSPGRFRFAFTVDGAESTGVFSGATGAGTEIMDVNGGVGVWHLTGSITTR